MLTLFRLIFLRNIRPITILFLTILLASVGLSFMLLLTRNVENQVSEQTRPLFGADIIVSPREYTPTPIIDQVAPLLSGTLYSWWERTEFSTTLVDREGKTGLVKVVAYEGIYPQKWILKTKPYWTDTSQSRVAATRELIDRFSLSGSLSLDGIPLTLTDEIIESSDLGFGFASENHLIVLPRALIRQSMLISSGSRLDQDLLISLSGSARLSAVAERLRDDPILASGSQIRTYDERSEQTTETTQELSSYILLIVSVAVLFAGVILRSTHDALFSSLSRTLSIVEILGFTRLRQMILFIMLYLLIVPGAILLSLVGSYLLLMLLREFPQASGFLYLRDALGESVLLMGLLIITAFAPAWILRYLPRVYSYTLPIFSGVRLTLHETVPLFLGIILILSIIFSDILMSLMIVSIGLIGLAIFWVIFWYGYRLLAWYAERWRRLYFPRFDWVRTLILPLIPSLPITLSLTLITTFFTVFLLFSFSFRDKLLLDTRESTNIYAVNILTEDIERDPEAFSGMELYSILRARISKVNWVSLADHLGDPDPSREFTREFNLTTSTLDDILLVRGKSKLESDEVSVDEDFAGRLWVDIGDTVEFLLSGKRITLEIVNIRKSVREWFRPFFYFSLEPETFRSAPKTYFASTYALDREAWKTHILSLTGPHVTFIDVESILRIARELSGKILSVIGLFLGSISLFALIAIVTLFARLIPLEVMRSRLYTLFGSLPRLTRESFSTTRVIILWVSYLIGVLIWGGVFLAIVLQSSFLSITFGDFLTVIGLIFFVYFVLFFFIRPQKY